MKSVRRLKSNENLSFEMAHENKQHSYRKLYIRFYGRKEEEEETHIKKCNEII